MALAFNLAAVPLKFVIIPVAVGFAAGTGALAAYVTAPATPASAATTTVAALPTDLAPVKTEQATPAPVRRETKPSCDQQTWPYLDSRCITRRDPARKVRLVMAPRNGDAVPGAASPALVTSDTVLRGPGVAPELKELPGVKKAAKHSGKHQRNDFRRVYSVYSVPSRGGDKPVIVVRPLPINQASRF